MLPCHAHSNQSLKIYLSAIIMLLDLTTCIINSLVVAPGTFQYILIRNPLLHFLSAIINSVILGFLSLPCIPLLNLSQLPQGTKSSLPESRFLQLLFILPLKFTITFHGVPISLRYRKILSSMFTTSTSISDHPFQT